MAKFGFGDASSELKTGLGLLTRVTDQAHPEAGVPESLSQSLQRTSRYRETAWFRYRSSAVVRPGLGTPTLPMVSAARSVYPSAFNQPSFVLRGRRGADGRCGVVASSTARSTASTRGIGGPTNASRVVGGSGCSCIAPAESELPATKSAHARLASRLRMLIVSRLLLQPSRAQAVSEIEKGCAAIRWCRVRP